MYHRHQKILDLTTLNLILIMASSHSELHAVSASLLIPVNRTPSITSLDVNTLRSIQVVPLDNQRIVDCIQPDTMNFLDSSKIVEAYTSEIAQHDRDIFYRRLRDVFVGYVTSSHVFGDDRLAEDVSEQLNLASLDRLQDQKNDMQLIENITPLDDATIINQAVRRVLTQRSFETLENVSDAIKELEQMIFQDLGKYGSTTDVPLIMDLQKLNSEPLSANYNCMKQVSQILSQLPPESAHAIREQFPWYLRRMV